MLPYSGDPRRSPPPPPLRAAFSSSLSPSAAPFPAADPVGPGRDLPTAPSVYAAGGDWATASWMEPPASYMAPAAAAAAGEVSQNPYGIYSRNHFSNFVGACLRSESSNSVSEKQPGSFPEISEALNNDFGSSVFHQQQNAFVNKLLDHSGAEDTVYPPQQDFIQYPFGSTYDKYMTQLSSCSKDSQPHIFSTRYVDSSEMAKTAVPLMNDTTGENSFSFSSYMNPIRINLDYFDCVWNEQKDLGYQTADKQHGKWSNSEDVATVGNYPLNSLGENHVGIEHLGNGRPMQESAETKHDLGGFNSKISSPEVGFVQPRDFSSELLEVNNTSVDSPCWKGTPASYQPSFGMTEKNDAPRTVMGTVGYISSHQSQKIPELSSEYPGRFPEHQEASVSKGDPFKAFDLSARCKNSEDHKEVPPVDVRVLNDMATYASYLPNKEHARTEKCYSTEDSKNVISLSQQESPCPAINPKLLGENGGSHTASTNEVMRKTAEKEEITQKRVEDHSQCYPGAEGNMLNMACDSSSSSRTIFLKLMHNLSVVLLSTCKDGSSLQEDEEELLQSVIQNLTAAKRSKMEQKHDDGLSNSSQLKFKNNNFSMAMHAHSAQENSDSEFKTTVSQVLTNHLDDKMPDDTEISKSAIYRNLWVEAEASACKLKYELQHARMKLIAAKGRNSTLKVTDSSEGCKGSSSSISSSKPQNHGKESIACTAALQGQGGDSGDRQSAVVSTNIFNGVDTDVLARFKLLQSRISNVSSFGEIDSEGWQEANKKSFAVEDAVMARLKVLKSRPDNIMTSQEINKHQLDASTNISDNVDDAVMARLRILESRPNSASILGQESSSQQLGESKDREDGADDAVMARLRILKSRPDNVTSLGDAGNEQEEACSDRLNEGDLSAVANGSITDTEVSTEQCWKFIQSDDLADHVGGKDSVGGMDTFGDGTRAGENETGGSADASTPKRCKATSDELNKEGAVHSENHVLLETTGDSHVCSEGSHDTHVISAVHQYGSAPSEWEHVLKENFFHPGK
ncbi:hypothetical protein HU200_018526 [Digitaria exilis]|uniref:Uncharacterized protein n=1 Tax=Digitaria exilis TaxID=1010633 RepID=A0A835F4N9_9POAL|nr:hypothetical protein HU200_018526 [Digitaria exilis]